MRLSQRMARLGTETAFEVLGRARALEARGKHVIHLEIGEPDFDTPAHITEAAVRALKGGATHYGPAAGIPELRAAVAEDTARRRGVRATPEMVVITPAAKHGVPVLADEIYSRILYDGHHVSIASLPGMEPLAIILDGFSKTYAMTGWRLGYGVKPAPMAQVVAKLQTNATSCTATFSQMAAVAALKEDQSAGDRLGAEVRRPPDVI